MEEERQATYKSPFLSIWTKPRETIRQIVDTDPKKHVMLLAMIIGVSQALERMASRILGDIAPLLTLLGFAIVLGPIGGLISLYFGGALYQWTGRWLGGEASSEEIRAAIAWASVPVVFILLLWIPEILIFGEELFTSSTPRMDANPLLIIVLLGFAAIKIILSVWTFVLLLKTIGEVQGFSAWKALGSILLGVLIIALPFICILPLIA